MRKLLYLFVATAFIMASCSTSPGYKITGTVQNAYDGEKVFLMERVNREFVQVDSTVIADNKFVFEGNQPEAALRYLAFTDGENDPIYVDFFLENGNIEVYLAEDETNTTVKGTAANEAFQNYKGERRAIELKMAAAYDVVRDRSAAEDERKVKREELDQLQTELNDMTKKYISDNVNSALGAYLLSANQYYMSYEEAEEFYNKMPANIQQQDAMTRLKQNIDAYYNTAEGKTFTDFEMLTPEGDPIKLSDNVGKGKYVLVDFWASWCGPCRQEMPRLVRMYEKYKSNGLEIVGVSLDRDGDAWKKGITDLNITWPQMSDLKFWNSEAAGLYAIRSIPHVLIIDNNGVIVSRGLYGEELEAKIDELMK